MPESLGYCYTNSACKSSVFDQMTSPDLMEKQECCNGVPEGSWGSCAGQKCEPCPKAVSQPEAVVKNPNVLQNSPKNACFGSGSDYWQTFDGLEFFQDGCCSFTLLQDAKRWITLRTYDCTAAGSKKELTIKPDGKNKVVAECSNIVVNDKKVTIDNDHPGYAEGVMQLRMVGTYFVFLYGKLVVGWNCDGDWFIELKQTEGDANGVCGNFDGNAENDLIRNGEEVKPAKFLESWSFGECPGITPLSPVNGCDLENSKQNCDILLNGPFKKCHDFYDVNNAFARCVENFCRRGVVALCEVLGEYSYQCSRLGVAVEWRTATLCSRTCANEEMIFIENLSACSANCQNLAITDFKCQISTLFPGCQCPEGKVEHAGKCVENRDCPCLYQNYFHEAGSTIPDNCNTCVCQYGSWDCTNLKCPKTCSVIGLQHFTTFDQVTYSAQSPTCTYTLVESKSGDLIIHMKNEEAGLKDTFQSRAVAVKIQAKADGKTSVIDVFMAGQKLVIHIDGKNLDGDTSINLGEFVVLHQYDSVVVAAPYFQIKISNYGNIFIKLDPIFENLVKGLCGNYNNEKDDDFQSISGLIVSKNEFFLSYSDCVDKAFNPDPTKDPCVSNVGMKTSPQIVDACNLLTNNSVLGDSCLNFRSGIEYYDSCLNDLCSNVVAAGFSSDAKIPNICHYLTLRTSECHQAGIEEVYWPNPSLIKRLCSDSNEFVCGEDMEYSACSPVQSVCGSKAVLNNVLEIIGFLGKVCMPGCSCKASQYLDHYNRCTEIQHCTCLDPSDQKIYPAGATIEKGCQTCQCIDGEFICDDIAEKTCPDGLIYVDDFLSCRHTCEAYGQLCAKQDKCGGCACPDNKVINHLGQCVDVNECPCTYLRRYFRAGDDIVNDGKKCTCNERNWVCEENNGKKGQCKLFGDVYYITFDGEHKVHTGQATCAYVIARSNDDNDDELCSKLHVSVSNLPCGQSGIICTKVVTAKVGDVTLVLAKGASPIVNGEKIDLTSGAYSSNDLSIVTTLVTTIAMFSNGVNIVHDGGTKVILYLPSCYKGNVNGLCGKYGGSAANADNGPGAVGPIQWKVDAQCPTSDDTDFNPCKAHPERVSWATQSCNIITQGAVFDECRKLVDFEAFYQECLAASCDCDTGGDCKCMCTAIDHFASTCAEKGVCVEWRSNKFCPVMCPEGQVFRECESPLDHLCAANHINAANIEGLKVEGCFCPTGTYLDGFNGCVKKEECGCFADKYYGPGESFKISCMECICKNGDVTCSGTTCECSDNTFSCRDGKGCITLENVCNSFPDCDDGSDEHECTTTPQPKTTNGPEDCKAVRLPSLSSIVPSFTKTLGWIEKDDVPGPNLLEEKVKVDDILDENVVVHINRCISCSCDGTTNFECKISNIMEVDKDNECLVTYCDVEGNEVEVDRSTKCKCASNERLVVKDAPVCCQCIPEISEDCKPDLKNEVLSYTIDGFACKTLKPVEYTVCGGGCGGSIDRGSIMVDMDVYRQSKCQCCQGLEGHWRSYDVECVKGKNVFTREIEHYVIEKCGCTGCSEEEVIKEFTQTRGPTTPAQTLAPDRTTTPSPGGTTTPSPIETTTPLINDKTTTTQALFTSPLICLPDNLLKDPELLISFGDGFIMDRLDIVNFYSPWQFLDAVQATIKFQPKYPLYFKDVKFDLIVSSGVFKSCTIVYTDVNGVKTVGNTIIIINKMDPQPISFMLDMTLTSLEIYFEMVTPSETDRAFIQLNNSNIEVCKNPGYERTTTTLAPGVTVTTTPAPPPLPTTTIRRVPDPWQPTHTCGVFGSRIQLYDTGLLQYPGTCKILLTKFSLNSTLVEVFVRLYEKNGLTVPLYLELHYGSDLYHFEKIFDDSSASVVITKNLQPFDASSDPSFIIQNNEVIFQIGQYFMLYYSSNYAAFIAIGKDIIVSKGSGFCGNNDNDPTNDYILMDGTPVDSNDKNAGILIGNSYIVDSPQDVAEKKCKPSVDPPPPPPCAVADLRCVEITNAAGIFKDCIARLSKEDIDKYKSQCDQDYQATCSDDAVCNSIAVFNKVCVAAGIVVNWRSFIKCPCQCSLANTECTLEASGCQPACGVPENAVCDKPNIIDGCVCHKDFVLFDGACIPKEECGCILADGTAKVLNDKWLNADCSEESTCTAGGVIKKEPKTCTKFQKCENSACIEVGIDATCTCRGDPHCKSFDDARYDYQGTCKFIYSKSKAGVTGIPQYVIYAKNYNRNGVTRVAYIFSAEVEFAGVVIHFERKFDSANSPVVAKVNNVIVDVPYKHAEGAFELQAKGTSEIEFSIPAGLKFRYNSAFSVLLSLPASFKDKVEGFCGNFDGNKENDILSPNGEKINPNLIGDYYVVEEGKGDKGANKKCAAKEITKQPEECKLQPVRCRMIDNKGGIFKKCIAVLPKADLKTYRTQCEFDLHETCEESVMCSALSDFARKCQSKGIAVNWRGPMNCPCKCTDPNQECVPVANGCQPTCNEPNPKDCTLADVRDACVCKRGFILFNGVCVDEAKCGCVDETGKSYMAGAVWYNNGCTEKFECNGATKTISNAPGSCAAGAICSVNKCIEPAPATCMCQGDPHCRTYDNAKYDYQSTCKYLYSKTIDSVTDKDIAFAVYAKNYNKFNNKKVAYVKYLEIEFNGNKVFMERKKDAANAPVLVTINGEEVPIPHNGNGYNVKYLGGEMVFETPAKLLVGYSSAWRMRVTLPASYMNKVTGFCGNFDGLVDNDFVDANGNEISKTLQFPGYPIGDSYIVDSAQEQESTKCRADQAPQPQCKLSPAKCSYITAKNGIFKQCIEKLTVSVVEAIEEDCVFDLKQTCRPASICSSLGDFANLCAQNGIKIKGWRKRYGCPCSCPQKNMVCSDEAPACMNSCSNLDAEKNCNLPPVIDTCVCKKGFILEGDQCVKANKCGCKDERGLARHLKKTWFNKDCTKKYTCATKDQITEVNETCKEGETCINFNCKKPKAPKGHKKPKKGKKGRKSKSSKKDLKNKRPKNKNGKLKLGSKDKLNKQKRPRGRKPKGSKSGIKDKFEKPKGPKRKNPKRLKSGSKDKLDKTKGSKSGSKDKLGKQKGPKAKKQKGLKSESKDKLGGKPKGPQSGSKDKLDRPNGSKSGIKDKLRKSKNPKSKKPKGVKSGSKDKLNKPRGSKSGSKDKLGRSIGKSGTKDNLNKPKGSKSRSNDKLGGKPKGSKSGSKDKLNKPRGSKSGSKDKLGGRPRGKSGSKDNLNKPKGSKSRSNDKLGGKPKGSKSGSKDKLNKPRGSKSRSNDKLGLKPRGKSGSKDKLEGQSQENISRSKDKLKKPRGSKSGSKDKLGGKPKGDKSGSKDNLNKPRGSKSGSKDKLGGGQKVGNNDGKQIESQNQKTNAGSKDGNQGQRKQQEAASKDANQIKPIAKIQKGKKRQ